MSPKWARRPTLDPKWGRRGHWLGVIIWGSQMVAVAYLMWPFDWKMYLVEISLAANVIGHLSGVSAERPTEVANGN